MADKEHLAEFRKAVDSWNRWRKANPKIIPDLSKADLSEIDRESIDLSRANLSGAIFTKAYLAKANFSGTNLSGAYLNEAWMNEVNFSNANLNNTEIVDSKLILANFERANLCEASLRRSDLHKASLAKANLVRADLLRTDFTEADLSKANLSNAFLYQAFAYGTSLKQAILTGACLEGWQINSTTDLSDVACEYIYLKSGNAPYLYRERCPSEPNKNFALGEFTVLFQKALETVDLIFSNGVDWDAFAYSFKKVQVENQGAQLDVQSIEKKGDGVLVVRVSVSPDVDKAKIHGDFMQGYEFAHKALEAQYQARLEDKDKHINQLFYLLNQSNEKLGEVPKLMAEAPKYDMRGSNFQAGFAETNYGTMVETQYNNMSQDLAQAAAHIQEVLTQLQTQGYSPEESQQRVANDLATQAKSNPTVMGKLVKWGQSLADAAAKTTVSEAAKGVFKLALRLSGVPLP